MISSSDILHRKVLIVDNQEVSVLLLERLLRGAGYVSITSTMDPGVISGFSPRSQVQYVSVRKSMQSCPLAKISPEYAKRSNASVDPFPRYQRST